MSCREKARRLLDQAAWLLLFRVFEVIGTGLKGLVNILQCLRKHIGQYFRPHADV